MSAWFQFDAIDVPRVLGVVAAVVVLWSITGSLRLRGWLKSSDSRKINHIAAFLGLAVSFGWLEPDIARPSAFACGAALVALVVTSSCFHDRWPWRIFVAANTREEDRPHEVCYFWSSWLISLVAIFAIDAVTADMRIVRLVAVIVGLADGLAEPVGRRWGRHRYRTPRWPSQAVAMKSLEGSLVVFAGTVLSVFLCEPPASSAILSTTIVATLLGVTALLVEALSPHGLDNATMPVALTAVLMLLGSETWQS